MALALRQDSTQTPAVAAAAHGAVADVDGSASQMRPYIERMAADRGSLLRTYNIEGSVSRAKRLREFYEDWLGRLERIPFETLAVDGQVDYILLRLFLERELYRLSFDERRSQEIAELVPFAQAILALTEARRGVHPVDPARAASALAELARSVGQLRRTLENRLRAEEASTWDHRWRILAARAAQFTSTLRNGLRDWARFYLGYDPLFTWWAEEPYRKADQALEEYRNFLWERLAGQRSRLPEQRTGEGSLAGPALSSPRAPAARAGETDDIIGDPIGRDALMAELRFELIPYTPEELLTLAWKQLSWCEDELRRASREMGVGEDWKQALERVKTMYVEPGKQPDLIRELAREAETFLDDHGLITIPPLARETWRMEMMPPERQLVNPFFTGGEVIRISFPTQSMAHEQKLMSMRGNNIPFARATVFHELIPGHHLQGFMHARYRSYRSLVGGTPFNGEGWAVYWEMLLYNMKFHKAPEDRVGALFWRMHRAARIIFSLSFHLGKMTPEECIRFLVERVGHEPENAAAEVRRSFGGAYSPLYQAAYLLGALQLEALRKEVVDAGKLTLRQFHDAVIRENRIPIELIRAALTGQKLTRNYTSQWRFAGDLAAPQ
jgi:uncharacterized protein (DUF885 family)